MSTWWAQCRREWLEHRLSLGWAPLIVAVLMVLVITTVLMKFSMHFAETSEPRVELFGTEVVVGDPMSNAPDTATFSGSGAIDGRTADARTQTAAPLFAWLYVITGCVMLLTSIFDERKDRSVLFWKSMPVSDSVAVLSKLFTVTVTSAVVISVCVCLSTLVIVFLTLTVMPTEYLPQQYSLLADMNLPVWVSHWVIGFITQAFWTLPIWGWALFVSAAAPSLPVLWGIALPLTLSILWSLVFNSTLVVSHILAHLEMRALPAERTHSTMASLFADQWSLWSSAPMWGGIAVGVAFVGAAIWLRGRNNQL